MNPFNRRASQGNVSSSSGEVSNRLLVLARLVRRHRARGESGATAIEFALVAPIFIFILMGIMEFGAALFIQNNMVNVARDASRRAATGEFTALQAETFAAGALVDWGIDYTIDVTVPDGTNPADQSVVASITAPMNQATIIDFLGLMAGRTLAAQAVMRQE